MLISFFSNNTSSEGERINLAAWITKSGSKQTFYTLRYLADGNRVQDALRAYAYFRWVDDQLDTSAGTPEEKQEFLDRQCALLDGCYRGEVNAVSTAEEQMLVDLVRSDTDRESGLGTYLYNMMGVMSFDVGRRGRMVTQMELSHYSMMLSKAVTEFMFYFFGHDSPPPNGPARYQAVIGAHVVHMLRDMMCDIEMGYFNFPAELLAGGPLSTETIYSDEFRRWVYERVKLAHKCFTEGREYIARVKNLRCRLAGFTYLARFEWMLRAIEKDQYCLRKSYPERKKFSVVLWMAGYVAASLFHFPRKNFEPVEVQALPEQCEER